VIVTYLPDLARLEHQLRALAGSVDGAVLVDNGSPGLDEQRLLRAFPALVVRRLGVNQGLAAAQNIGSGVARRLGAAYVLFLDQDSVPEKNMACRLRETLERLAVEGRKVGLVGPRFRAADGGAVGNFARVGLLWVRRVACDSDSAAVECDALISSGSLVPVAVLDDVGGMEEGLFIDQVDTEWCLRARAKGYRVFGACDAILDHRLGEDLHRLWFGRWRNLFRHKPFRYYYIFRNTVSLLGRDYVPFPWKLYNLRWLAALFVIFGILRGRNFLELKMMLRGIRDGLRGVTGRLKVG
jgi:rhamnosyltransferase